VLDMPPSCPRSARANRGHGRSELFLEPGEESAPGYLERARRACELTEGSD